MALPAILATYSSIYLLVGLVVMVVHSSGTGIEAERTGYILVTMIPVGLGFLFLCISIGLCEAGTRVEAKGRKKFQKDYKKPKPSSGKVGERYTLTLG